ncbi:MAG: hypothetical protein K8S18_04710 [Desulfobacula sp.]|nr:hypothetical protein [Desulfobacula sp.]
MEFISPYPSYTLRYGRKKYDEVAELLTIPHFPSEHEKEKIHDKVIELSDSDIPDWFFMNEQSDELRYSIYDEKLFMRTWDHLLETNLAKQFQARIGRTMYNTIDDFGLHLMSIIAEVCAGSQKDIITDEVRSFAIETKHLTYEAGGEYGNKDMQHERLVSIAIKSLNFKNIRIDRLLALRKREYKNGDTVLPNLRKNYRESLESYVNRLRNNAKSLNDIKEIERVFEQEISHDMKDLKKELKIEIRDVILSKEVAVAAIAAPFVFVEPITSTLLSSAALVRADLKYRKKREEILKKHFSSWLYVAENKYQLL